MLEVLCGDAIEKLRELPGESVQCVVTSPPYWGLRDYGTAEWEGGEEGCDHIQRMARGDSGRCSDDNRGGNINPAPVETPIGFRDNCGKCGARRIDSQLGLEKTPEEYVRGMVDLFREVRRVLRKDGTLWLNLGDSYAQSGGKQEPEPLEVLQERAQRKGYDVGGWGAKTKDGQGIAGRAANTAVSGLKPKDLCGIPWRVAFALQADGWWLRSDIIWAKSNPMPESVTDRPTKSHEYLFLLTKSANYFYDAEAIKEQGEKVGTLGHLQGGNGERAGTRQGLRREYVAAKRLDPDCKALDSLKVCGDGLYSQYRNKRSVWTIATQAYAGAHFATFPEDLVKPCIMAGTSAKGCCARCGAPWERVVETPDFSQQPKRNSDRWDFRNGDRTSAGQAWQDWRNENPNKTLGWQATCKCTDFDPVHGFPMGVPIEPCTVLDPFAGSGTTGMVALELGRRAILIELNPKYIQLIRDRCNVTHGLALC